MTTKSTKYNKNSWKYNIDCKTQISSDNILRLYETVGEVP